MAGPYYQQSFGGGFDGGTSGYWDQMGALSELVRQEQMSRERDRGDEFAGKYNNAQPNMLAGAWDYLNKPAGPSPGPMGGIASHRQTITQAPPPEPRPSVQQDLTDYMSSPGDEVATKAAAKNKPKTTIDEADINQMIDGLQLKSGQGTVRQGLMQIESASAGSDSPYIHWRLGAVSDPSHAGIMKAYHDRGLGPNPQHYADIQEQQRLASQFSRNPKAAAIIESRRNMEMDRTPTDLERQIAESEIGRNQAMAESATAEARSRNADAAFVEQAADPLERVSEIDDTGRRARDFSMQVNAIIGQGDRADPGAMQRIIHQYMSDPSLSNDPRVTQLMKRLGLLQ